jgi:hypothetical protein
VLALALVAFIVVVVVVAAVAAAVVTGFLVVAVAFLRDESVVRRFTAIVDVDATGFLVVVFITVAFFDGFAGAMGRLVGFEPAGDSVETDVRGGTGFLVPTGFVGFGFDVTFCVLFCVSFLIESWMDWNVVSLMLSVVDVMLARVGSSFNLIVLETLRSTMVPSVVEKPPTLIEYFSVVPLLSMTTMMTLWSVAIRKFYCRN